MRTVPLSAETPKILLADDSPGEREKARTALDALGYRVVEAQNGQEAVELFLREQPDLIMLDVVMPKLSGIDACRILKARTKKSFVPIIMVSSRNSVHARVEGLKSGADDYLGKPYDDEELAARIEALLRTKGNLTSGSHEGDLVDEAGESVEEVVQAEDLFRERLEEEFARAERFGDPMACLALEIHSRHGQEIGDPQKQGATVELGKVVRNSIRKIDHAYQRGADGFWVILPGTHFSGALAVTERIMNSFRQGAASDKVDAGVAFFPAKGVQNANDVYELSQQAIERVRSREGGEICLIQNQGYIYEPEG